VDFLTLGISFKTAPLALREKAVIEEDGRTGLLERFRDDGILREVLILSTCNRTEIYAVHGGEADTVDYLCGAVEKVTGSGVLCDPEVRYVHRDRMAVEHLFRVGSGLDSMVIGEPQITGQVKEAYSTTCRARATGAFLNKLLHMTFRVAKKIRTETGIGTGTTSVASAAVQRLRGVLDGLTDRTVLLIGAGKNGELAARHLLSAKVAKLLIANRSPQKARELAYSLGGEGSGLDALPALLKDADAVVSTTSSPDFILTRAMLEKSMADRAERPLIIADIAAPRDAEPGISELSGVELFDLDSLKKAIEENLSNRRKIALQAEEIIQRQVRSFMAWYRALMVKPIIIKLEEQTENVRKEELEKLKRHFNDEQMKKIDHFARLLQRRFLHNPLSQIKLCDRGTHLGMMRLDAIRDLFGLEDDES
jgi:glutamyl-tRNA reductase